MTFREYLCREAERITERARVRCAGPAAPAIERRRAFHEMLGIDALMSDTPRPPVPCTVTGTVDRQGYRIEKLYFESLPGLRITANLYVPDAAALAPVPGIVYVCGHAETQKVHYQMHPRRFAELGMMCLIVDTVQLGEERGEHYGCYDKGWFHWYSRGFTPAGLEAYNAIRALDLLAARADVDATKLGITGSSGGGATTWWTAAADERVACAAPVCATGTLASLIANRNIDGHCDCMWWINHAQWDLADVGALIAPRALLIASSDRDMHYAVSAIREVHAQLIPVYATTADRLAFVETPGPHGYHARSRTAIYAWFVRHLAGGEVSVETVGDAEIDPAKQESMETLRVYGATPPSGNRIARIHDEFIPTATLPDIPDRAALAAERARVEAALRRTTFASISARTVPPAVIIGSEFEHGSISGCRFSFTVDDGWKLGGRLWASRKHSGPLPVTVVLASPGDPHGASNELAKRIPEDRVRIVIETSGTGETAAGEALQPHLRRVAAWTGWTVASLRVRDSLAALAAIRNLPRVDGAHVALAAKGDMAVVAFYTALLDGHVDALMLEDIPATHNASGSPDGREPAIELLSCLRVTDLSHVAGLLYPCAMTFSGAVPVTFNWAEDLYRRLGSPGTFERT